MGTKVPIFCGNEVCLCAIFADNRDLYIYIYKYVSMKPKACCDCDIFKALGDKTRYRIAAALLGGELCACELPKIVKRAQPTVSLQLKCLSKAGVVSSRREGKKIIYKIADPRVKLLVKKGDLK